MYPPGQIYGMLGVEARLCIFKASTFLTVLYSQPLGSWVFFFCFLRFILVLNYMYMCVGLCTCECRLPWSLEKGVGSPVATPF